ncbi:MAG TPA: hypothetical protein VEU47_12725 [Candidatus Cybelea sp.]|nr:hypothetical protein [Candidatus Cybelea sp.]
MRSALRLIAINVALLLAAMLALNFLSALALDLRDGAHALSGGKRDARIDLPAYADKAAATQIFNDYYKTSARYTAILGWTMRPMTSATLTIGQDGRRSTGLPPGGPVTLQMFGGSTMWGTGADDRHTIPGLLQARFPAITVENNAQSGFTSRQSLDALINLLNQGRRVDAAVFYDGANDVAFYCNDRLSLNGDAYELVFRKLIEGNLRGGSRVAGWLNAILFRDTFALAGVVGDWLNARLHPGAAQAPDGTAAPNYVCDTDPKRAMAVAELMLADWRLADALVSKSGGTFIGVLQPIAYVGTPRTDYLDLDPTLGRQYRAVYPLVLRLMADRGITYAVDLTDAIDGTDPVYIDWAHVTAAGNARIAERIGAALAPRLPN